MKFRRSTHIDGKLKDGLPQLVEDEWITCCIHLIDNEWMSLEEIYEAHAKYDAEWLSEGFMYSIADILSGLSALIRLGLVEAGD
jgi:predicted transcriptional regulator